MQGKFEGMKTSLSSNKGFTLIELMVVVAIIAILSAGSGIMVGSVKGTLVPYQASLFIDDIMNGVEEEVSLLERYEEVTVNFFKDSAYLVMVAKPQGYSLDLEWDKAVCNGMGGPVSTDMGFIRHEADRKFRSLTANTNQICEDFMSAEENEWSYQLINGEDVSPVIRLVHFNNNPEDAAAIITDDDSRIVMIAPYAKKRFYDGLAPEPNTNGTLVLNLEYDSHSKEKTFN